MCANALFAYFCTFLCIFHIYGHLCKFGCNLDMPSFAHPSPLVSRSVTAEYKDYLLLLLMNKCVTVSLLGEKSLDLPWVRAHSGWSGNLHLTPVLGKQSFHWYVAIIDEPRQDRSQWFGPQSMMFGRPGWEGSSGERQDLNQKKKLRWFHFTKLGFA